jgi:hypothetical protein
VNLQVYTVYKQPFKTYYSLEIVLQNSFMTTAAAFSNEFSQSELPKVWKAAYKSIKII